MKVYLVGGAVRDEVMGLDPKDRDYVVVGATPEQMIADGFEQVGADFPVFLHPETREEYALARTERKNGSGYHGFAVTFDQSITLREDLERRDLTINSMAREPHGDQIFDPFGGLDDLHNKILRHTSAAFADDPLRVIRLARFAARYEDFFIADETYDLAIEMVRRGDLDELPFERFAAEINKAIDTMQGRQVALFFATLLRFGVFEHTKFFKEMDPHRCVQVANALPFAHEKSLVFATLAIPPEKQAVHVAGNGVRDMKKLVRLVKRPTDVISCVYDLLNVSRAWNSSAQIDLFYDVLKVMYQMGDYTLIHPAELEEGIDAMGLVPQHLGDELVAQGLDGKTIGLRIAEARRQAVTTGLTR